MERKKIRLSQEALKKKKLQLKRLKEDILKESKRQSIDILVSGKRKAAEIDLDLDEVEEGLNYYKLDDKLQKSKFFFIFFENIF